MSQLVVDNTNNELTYQIIGAAMAVHNSLGAGFKEDVYERALMVELARLGIPAQAQYGVEVFHHGEMVGLFFLDIFVDGMVVVELKALSHPLTNDEIAQVINYLKASQAKVGLLFNFGRRKLEYRRIFPPKDLESPVQRVGRDGINE